MKNKAAKATTIDEYISGFPYEIQRVLKQVRSTIRKAAPAAQETISYRVPAFRLEGPLVYFAAFKNHVGFFPTSSGIWNFKKELGAYESAKGSVRFPLDQPMPLGLIARITKFRLKENQARAKARRKNKHMVS
jgi:uncharacterized protein YdhG (YjbR/CyaY superfamily)